MEQSKSILLIVGGQSTAVEIREVADKYYASEYSQIYNLVGDSEETSLSNVLRDAELEAFLAENEVVSYIIGVSHLKVRRKFKEIFSKYAGAKEVNVIHPSAIISPSAEIGVGNYIAGNAVVSSNAKLVGSSLINFNATIGHDCMIGSDCCINPGARISGHVTLGNGVLIGANSCVYQGLSIGDNSAVDAMTYVTQNIESGKMCTNRMGALKIYKRIG